MLVYGFGTTRRVFRVMEKRLRKDGFDVFSINMGGVWDIMWTGNIEWRAQFVADKVEQLYAKYDMGPLAIIGHSEGGVISRYYVQCLGGDKRAQTLITLASPHRGTPAAVLGAMTMGALARNLFQLIPSSPFMRRLARKPFPHNVKFVSIYSGDDWVCPASYCRAVDDKNNELSINVELPGLGHNDFLLKKSPYKTIRRVLFGLPITPECSEAVTEGSAAGQTV
jgi:pimeloyl-ACP methyl ester carboxylesterase